MHNVVTEESLLSRSSEFEAAIQNGERSSLKLLCEKKLQESEYVLFHEVMEIFLFVCLVFFPPPQLMGLKLVSLDFVKI